MVRGAPPPSLLRRFIWPGVLCAVLIACGAVTLTLRGVDIFGLVASATSSVVRAPITLYMTPYEDARFNVGDVKKIDVVVNAAEPINAIGTTIKFPRDSIEILGFNKEKSFFDLWTEETAIREEDGEIHFSGGTTNVGGMRGTGTVLTLIVRAKKSGETKLFFKDAEAYAADGLGTLLDNETRELPISVNETPSTTYVPVTSESQPAKPLPRTADVNTDGAVNLVDVSIMIMRLVMPYDYHFDLDLDGAITIADVSIVLATAR